MTAFSAAFWRSPRAVLGVLVLTAAVRAGVLVAQFDALQQDPDAYRLFAETLVETGVYAPGVEPGGAPQPSAYRPPLYPLLLALCLKSPLGFLPTVAVVHWALGLATVGLVLAIAGRVPRLPTALAGLLVALDPLLLHSSTLLMTETLAAFLAALAMLLLANAETSRGNLRWGLAGATLGLAALCRPTFLLVIPLAAMIVVLRQRRWQSAAALAAAGAIVLAPWAARNWIALGRPVVATTHGGYTLHLANNPAFYEYLRSGPWGSRWQPPQGVEPGDYLAARLAALELVPTPCPGRCELATDRAHYEAAMQTIRRAPGTFAYATLVRLGRLWQLLPRALDSPESLLRRSLRYAIALWYAAEFVLVALGLWRLWRSLVQGPWVWALLLLASFTLLHAFYWSNMRMRAPLVPALALLAAAAPGSVARVARAHREERKPPPPGEPYRP